MPDFPGAYVSNVISKVVSGVIPPHLYVFLVALVPGLFFELSILLANPSLFCELFARGQDGSGMGRYAIWGVVLFFAFVIGNAFILLVTLIQRLLGYLYGLWAWVREELCIWPLSPIMAWLGKKPWFFRRRRFREFADHIQLLASGTPLDVGARKLWSIVARRLLKERYGIGADNLGQEEWNALYQTLGTLRIEDVRGSMTMIVSEATGWCGIAATWFAPTLRNRYYVAFCALLIVAGLLHDWYVAAGLNNPLFLGFLKVRALLREFQNTTTRSGRSLLPAAEPDTPQD